MTVHRVDFYYTRRVSIYVEADDAEDLEEYLLEEGGDWDPVEDAPEMIEHDVSEHDGAFEVVVPDGVRVANYVLTDEGIQEK